VKNVVILPEGTLYQVATLTQALLVHGTITVDAALLEHSTIHRPIAGHRLLLEDRAEADTVLQQWKTTQFGARTWKGISGSPKGRRPSIIPK
jgi:hypothetical protein